MIIYTDGACKGNPGPGGWGYIAIEAEQVVNEERGGNRLTTNNEMELFAIYKALKYAQGKVSKVTLFTDSNYAINCLTVWYANWERRGFLTSNRTPVKNKELIQSIKREMEKMGEVELRWIKGHSGNVYNTRADELANLGVQECMNMEY